MKKMTFQEWWEDNKMKKDTERETDLEFKCDMCEKRNASFDGKTKMGPWAYMCEECFAIHGIGVGLGKGQKLIYKQEA